MITGDVSCCVPVCGDLQLKCRENHKLHIFIQSYYCFLQENVSCLNTTLVFLMFANRKNALPRYLQALRDEKEDMMEVSGSANLLRNFRSGECLHLELPRYVDYLFFYGSWRCNMVDLLLCNE